LAFTVFEFFGALNGHSQRSGLSLLSGMTLHADVPYSWLINHPIEGRKDGQPNFSISATVPVTKAACFAFSDTADLLSGQVIPGHA
jgi:hypothetical protein